MTVPPDAPEAPRSPGIRPTWASSDKDLVGTSLGSARLWYTLGHGILNEVYCPRIDIAQVRDLGFIVADGHGFWCEVKRLPGYVLETPAPGVPLATVVHSHPRFNLTLRICPDPRREVLLLEFRLDGEAGMRPYVLLAPHLGGTGRDNLAWCAEYGGGAVLWAEQGPFGLALAARDEHGQDAYAALSVGYVGTSDGWQDFSRHGRMTWDYGAAGPGNVAMIGALQPRGVLALGLATSKEAAATLACAALAQRFDEVWQGQAQVWAHWHEQHSAVAVPPDLPEPLARQFRISAGVLKTHLDKSYAGAMVASLSVPWGNSREERGGYHLVWPRDLVESAGALLALGAFDEARDTLRYLLATQQRDGHWFQNQWLGGKPYWQGLQLDEAAFPVLLAAALAERGQLDGIPVAAMVAHALAFLVSRGPASPQDRWEEDAGLNPFTLAVCIAALVAGSEFVPKQDAELAVAVADFWNARLEDWTVARSGQFVHGLGVAGYYVREAPAGALASEDALCRVLPVKNRRHDPDLPAAEQVGLEFLQLVRFGLRDARDPLVVDSIRVADALLRVETPKGPVWHRYNGDGYGEHLDGSPFDGTGRGRAWPLLTGERGHYALTAGEDPLSYLSAMDAMTGDGGLIPEQVWDEHPPPGRQPGAPSGSAMPLLWAHAEYIKLAVSRQLGRPSDRPAAVWARYGARRPEPEIWIWTPAAPVVRVPRGKSLWLLFSRPVLLHWGRDGWQHIGDLPAAGAGLEQWRVILSAGDLAQAQTLEFTWQWQDSGAWLGRDYRIVISPR